MSNYGIVTDPSLATTAALQSADAADLQDKVNSYIASLDALTTLITDITLAGAGDGHTFVVLVESAPQGSVQGGLPCGNSGGIAPSLVRCFLAGTAEELLRAQTATGVPASVLGVGYSAMDVQMAGASKGTRFMGMTVFSLDSVPTPLASPFCIAQRKVSPQTIPGAGTLLVSFDALNQSGTNFSLPVATAIRYLGKKSVDALVDVSIAVILDAAGDVNVELVSDPNGTPQVLASMPGSVAVNGNTTNISIPWSYVLQPFSFATATADLGVQVTTDQAGSIPLCDVRIAAR
jgi:hypothetical protein